MSKVEIKVADYLPKQVGKYACECQKKPFDFRDREAQVFWLVQTGTAVEANQPLCSAEVDKAVVEICAPCDGVLIEKTREDGETFSAGDVLGTIEV